MEKHKAKNEAGTWGGFPGQDGRSPGPPQCMKCGWTRRFIQNYRLCPMVGSSKVLVLVVWACTWEAVGSFEVQVALYDSWAHC